MQAPDGRLVYANDAAARACGFATAAELLEATRDEILGRFELFDASRTPLDPAELPGAAILRGGPETSRVVGFRVVATGEERWSIVSATSLRDAAGRPEFAINAFHDITALRRAEEERDRERARLAAILEERLAEEAQLAALILAGSSRAAELNAIIGAIGEGIVVIDREGRFGLANRTAREMLAPFEDADLDSLLRRFDRIRQERAGERSEAGVGAGSLRAALRRGPVQARLGGAGGRWIEIAAYPVPDPADGEETILVLRDVTAAREREEARDAFIGMLSHELRTPVTTIYAGAKVLARSERLTDAARRDIFDDIHAEAERLHRLVEDVVALTRFGEGALEIGSEPVLLQRVLPAVVRSEEGRWPDGSFEVRLPPGLPPVAGEATYIEQVVRNLLANAVKYAGSGAKVAIEAAAAGDEVLVRVLDEGPGFPAEDAARLFDLYYRSPATAQKVSGSGIGLFVCSRLVEAMGGRMWAANRSAGGAEFGFSLRVIEER